MVELGRREVVGIDIGSHSVKAVQLRKTHKGWSVRAGAVVEIGDKGTDSPVKKEANTMSAILTSLRLAGIKTHNAVCSLGGHDVSIRNFDFPSLPDDELEMAVLFEARQVCHFSTIDIAVDYNIVDNNKGRSKGYLVATTNRLLKNRVKMIKKAKLNCVLMDVDALALLNCFSEIENSEKDHGTAILNIGNNHTTMVIDGNEGWPFVRNLNFAGDEVIKQIAEENDITTEEVRKNIIEGTETQQAEIHNSLARMSERLASDIEKTLLYYSTQENSFDIENILVCGGFSQFDKIVKFLDNRLPVNVRLWNPFEKMRCYGGHKHRGILLKNIIKKNGPAMTIAAGLAMRTI